MKDARTNRNTSPRTVVVLASVAAAVIAIATLATNTPIEDAGALVSEAASLESMPSLEASPSLSLPLIGSAHAAAMPLAATKVRPAPRLEEPWNADESSRGSRPDASH